MSLFSGKKSYEVHSKFFNATITSLLSKIPIKNPKSDPLSAQINSLKQQLADPKSNSENLKRFLSEKPSGLSDHVDLVNKNMNELIYNYTNSLRLMIDDFQREILKYKEIMSKDFKVPFPSPLKLKMRFNLKRPGQNSTNSWWR